MKGIVINRIFRMGFIQYFIIAAVFIGVSFTPYKLLGMLLAIGYLVVERFIRKRQKEDIGFNFKGIPKGIRETWLYIMLVVFVSPLIWISMGKLVFPEYLAHVVGRVTPYITTHSIGKMLVELLVLAFGEEIVFRSFLQGRLSLFIKPGIALVIVSFVFAALHYTPGSTVVVSLDLVSVFIDSLLLGTIFNRSNNVDVSTIAHFLGNSFSILSLLALGYMVR